MPLNENYNDAYEQWKSDLALYADEVLAIHLEEVNQVLAKEKNVFNQKCIGGILHGIAGSIPEDSHALVKERFEELRSTLAQLIARDILHEAANRWAAIHERKQPF